LHQDRTWCLVRIRQSRRRGLHMKVYLERIAAAAALSGFAYACILMIVSQ
jgi:hypothetical protein